VPDPLVAGGALNPRIELASAFGAARVAGREDLHGAGPLSGELLRPTGGGVPRCRAPLNNLAQNPA
jgi:hypothetical protein